MGLFKKLIGKESTHQPHEHDVTHRIVQTVRAFMDCSMILVDPDLEEFPEKPMIIFGYAFGAVDAIAQRNDAEGEPTLIASVVFFKENFNMTPEEAGKITRLCMDMVQDPLCEHYVREGGLAILQWVTRRDEHAPLRLFELMKAEKEKRK